MKISIIIPTFNEGKTLPQIIDMSLKNLKYEIELIVVDDCSTDNTRDILSKSYSKSDKIKIIYNLKNMGKGFCVRKGIEYSSGNIILIQDADLEYNPKEHNRLIDPIAENVADVVYGSRFVGQDPHRVIYFFNRIANSFLTTVCNILTNLNLTDMETGLKAFKSDQIKKIILKEDGFGIEPELTIKLSKLKFFEVGISYYGRTYEEGKKIRAKHFFEAIFVMLKYKFLK
jgi:glycosyltransferase involved in cell wall biosynthesis